MPLHLTSGHPSYYVDIHIIELLSTAMLYRGHLMNANFRL